MERCGNTVLGNTDARQDGASVHGCTDVQYRGMHTWVHTHITGEQLSVGGGPAGAAGMRGGPELPTDPSGVAVLQGLWARAHSVSYAAVPKAKSG